MRNKSLKKNSLLNIIRVLATIIFPLVTFPYISKILGSVNIGKVQFGQSLISYISLIAALGVSAYGTKTCTPLRDNREKFNKVASEIFTVNLISTFFSYLVLFLLLLIPNVFDNYRDVILIQSFTVLFSTIGVDWIYSANEDYKYITIRSILVQFIAFCLMFTLVKNEDDYIIYVITIVISNVGMNIFNFFHAKKYCDLRIVTSGLKKHFPSLLTLFASNLAVQIYINSDIIMLGIMTNEHNVGVYSFSAKIYMIIKNLINAVITVTIPRFALLFSNGKIKEYKQLSSKIIQLCICLLVPALIGIFCLSDNIILLASTQDFLDGSTSLRILSIALIFAVLSNFFGHLILITCNLERKFMLATTTGALANIILNFLLIPHFSQNGAATTTVVAELIVMALCAYYGRSHYDTKGFLKNLLQVVIASFSIIVTYIIIHSLKLNIELETIATILISIVSYFTLLLIMKNNIVVAEYNKILDKLSKK